MTRYQRLTPQGVLKTVAICDRCGFRYNLVELRKDGDSPGLLVCRKCADKLDPYKLPPRQEDRYAVRDARPDEDLTFEE